MPSFSRCDSRVGIIGVTGAVGSEALSILAERAFPAEQVVCIGSERSAGNEIQYRDRTLSIHRLGKVADLGLDFVISCADAQVAHDARSLLRGSNTVLIDNSSAFRMESDTPLVVPEVNGDKLTDSPSVIANPNCSTVMFVRVLEPMQKAFGLQGVTVTSYQAVSGAGRAGISELRSQTQAAISGSVVKPMVFPVSCAFNVFEHESPTDPCTGFNGEETKIINETRRILGIPTLPVLPTCVRVPVERAHAQSIILEISKPATVEEARTVLIDAGIYCAPHGEMLTPLEVAGTDDVQVGRIRVDPSSDGRRILLWICCDQIRKGAALNTVQIMDQMMKSEYPVGSLT